MQPVTPHSVRAVSAALRRLADRLLGMAGRTTGLHKDADAALVLPPRELSRVTLAGRPSPAERRAQLRVITGGLGAGETRPTADRPAAPGAGTRNRRMARLH